MKKAFYSHAISLSQSWRRSFKSVLIRLRKALLPTETDGLQRITLKLGTCVILVAVLTVSIVTAIRFSVDRHQLSIVEKDRAVWHSTNEREEQFSKMKKRNPDFCLWIQIPDTEIDYPVFHSDKKGFYNTHNSLKKAGTYGALSTSGDESCRVIYAAANQNNPLGCLSEYALTEYYHNHPNIYISAPKEDVTYRVFAVLITNSSPDQDNGLRFPYNKTSFQDDDEREAFIHDALRRSMILTNIFPQPSDPLLTLVTDSDEFDGAKFVVMARRLTQEELLSPPAVRAITIAQPYFPQIWYQKHGLETPRHKE